MTTAEQIYEKAQSLNQPAQKALLQIVELLAGQPGVAGHAAPKAGSAKGLVEIGPDFDEPLEDFRPYMA
jgi:hypothetical protein